MNYQSVHLKSGTRRTETKTSGTSEHERHSDTSQKSSSLLPVQLGGLRFGGLRFGGLHFGVSWFWIFVLIGTAFVACNGFRETRFASDIGPPSGSYANHKPTQEVSEELPANHTNFTNYSRKLDKQVTSSLGKSNRIADGCITHKFTFLSFVAMPGSKTFLYTSPKTGKK